MPTKAELEEDCLKEISTFEQALKDIDATVVDERDELAVYLHKSDKFGIDYQIKRLKSKLEDIKSGKTKANPNVITTIGDVTVRSTDKGICISQYDDSFMRDMHEGVIPWERIVRRIPPEFLK